MARPRGFQYGTLLRVRKRQEDLCAETLAAKRREVAAAQAQRASIGREQERVLLEAGQRARRRFLADDVRRYYLYERHLAQQAVHTDARIVELGREAQARRAELEEAMKRRRILERLQERQDGACRAHLAKDERDREDETAANHEAAARARARGAAAETPSAQRGTP